MRNYIEIMNECTVFISTESMLLYTNICDMDQQIYVGWFNVGMLTLNMIVNILIVVYKTLHEVIFRFYWKHKNKKYIEDRLRLILE